MHNFQASSCVENSTAVLGPTGTVLSACAGITPILQGQYNTPGLTAKATRTDLDGLCTPRSRIIRHITEKPNTYICSPPVHVAVHRGSGAGVPGSPLAGGGKGAGPR